MAGVYVDTSSLGRLLLGEHDAPAIGRALRDRELRHSSRLLETELTRLAVRTGLEHRAGPLLESVSLVPLDEAVLRASAALPPADLGTLGAIHLATALALDRRGAVDALMTHDRRLAAAAREHGLEVLAPA